MHRFISLNENYGEKLMLLCRNDDQLHTPTRNGKVPHLLAKIGGFELSMPVRMVKDKYGGYEAETDKFGYVYALPANRKIGLNGDITYG